MLLVRLYIESDEYNLIEGEVYNAKHSTNKYYLDIYLPNGDILKELYIGRFRFLSEKEVRKYKINQLMNKL